MIRSVYHVHVYCDVAGCWNSDGVSFANKVPDEDARKLFRARAWKFSDGRTECPRHEKRKEHAA